MRIRITRTSIIAISIDLLLAAETVCECPFAAKASRRHVGVAMSAIDRKGTTIGIQRFEEFDFQVTAPASGLVPNSHARLE